MGLSRRKESEIVAKERGELIVKEIKRAVKERECFKRKRKSLLLIKKCEVSAEEGIRDCF